MEEKVLNEMALGSEGGVKLVVADGKLKLEVKYDSKGLDGVVGLELDPDYFIDKLAEAIPGKVDDAILNILKAALKG
jgi:hypothetical protein